MSPRTVLIATLMAGLILPVAVEAKKGGNGGGKPGGEDPPPACTGGESPVPEVVFMTAPLLDGEYETQDIHLASASGCHRYPMVEDAMVRTPLDAKTKSGHITLASVDGLRVAMRGDVGLITWIDRIPEQDPMYGLWFAVNSEGEAVADPGGVFVLNVSPAPYRVSTYDVRLDDTDEFELALFEVGATSEERRLRYRRGDDTPAVVLSGTCPFQAQGACYQRVYSPWWNSEGTELLMAVYSFPDTDAQGIFRLPRSGGVWQATEVVVAPQDHSLDLLGVRSDGILAVVEQGNVSKKGGPRNDDRIHYSLDPASCGATGCAVSDGTRLSVNFGVYPRAWTRAGGLIFMDRREHETADFFEYTNPETGEIGGLELRGVGRNEWDTAY